MKRVLLPIIIVGLFITMLLSVPRSKVIVEIGTGTWCTYCPGAAMGADDLHTNNQPVGIVENHNGDPFANVYSNARNTYYGITGFPTAYFDGGNPTVGGSHTQSMYSNYLPKVTSRIAVPSNYTLSAGGSANGNTYNITVNAAKVSPDTNTNIRLHVCLTQSNISYNWQGQTHLEFVNRLMIPDQNGTSLDFSTVSSHSIPLSFTLDNSWPAADMELVIFLQNNSTKEIGRGERYTLAEIGGVCPVNVTSLNFPNTYLTGSATMPFTITNYWNQLVTGTITCNNPVFTISPAPGNYTLNPYASQTYNVTFSPTTVGTHQGTITITSNLTEYPQMTIQLSGVSFFNSAPVANNVSITGVPVITTQLTASYQFVDAENDTEGNSIRQWYRVQGGNQTPIQGATNLTYRITQADQGYAIGFKVTPVDQWGMQGTPVMSPLTPVIGDLPAPQNLTATVQNSNNVILDWDPPQYFNTRDFVGYRVYRNELSVQTITNLNQTSWTDINLMNGDYDYWVVSIFNNPLLQSAPSNIVTVHIGTSNEEQIVPVINFRVYPNPVQKEAYITLSSKANSSISIGLYNIKGQLLKNIEGLTDSQGNANLILKIDSDIRPGIYILKTNGKNEILTQKILVTN